MKKTIFTGAGVAIVTPMHDDLSINWELLGELIDYQIDNGTDAIVIVRHDRRGLPPSPTRNTSRRIALRRSSARRTASRSMAGVGSNDTAYSL